MNPTSDEVRYNDAVASRAIGRYQVVRLLGSGSFATVYLARDDRLDTDVAIKLLAENWCNDAEISRRFLEEARMLRRCDDDRVVRVHTIEQLDDGRPYFVMDFADAGTLADRMLAALDDGRPFGLREAVGLSCDLADCLSVVHDSGIVHRDLKPSNVLFRTVRAHERMVLGDFGLARQMIAASGKTILAGTPEYVAPEQADPKLASTVDERADVYAAAVILHELLAGALPFGYSSLDQAAAAGQGPPDLVAARPDAPAELAAVVARGMAPDRDARFPTGQAWLAALREVLAALPDDPAYSEPGRPHSPPLPTPLDAVVPVGAVGWQSAAGPPLVSQPAAAGPVVTPAPPRPGGSAAAAGPVVAPVPPGPEPGPATPGQQPTPGGPAAGPTLAPSGGARSGPAGGAASSAWAPGGGPPSEGGAGLPPPQPPAPTPAPDQKGRKPLWPLFAGVLAALALVAAIVVVIGRSGGSGSSQAVGPTLTPVPSTPATSALPDPVPGSTPATSAPRTGPAAWFAAASGSTCRPAVTAEMQPGVVAAVTCTYPGVVAVFGQTASPAAAAEFLARLTRRRSGSTETAWADGHLVVYGGTANPAIAWDYTGQPYVGIAVSNSRSTLTTWWGSTGRKVRSGA